MKPLARGEMEIISENDEYLKQQLLKLHVRNSGIAYLNTDPWSDEQGCRIL